MLERFVQAIWNFVTGTYLRLTLVCIVIGGTIGVFRGINQSKADLKEAIREDKQLMLEAEVKDMQEARRKSNLELERLKETVASSGKPTAGKSRLGDPEWVEGQFALVKLKQSELELRMQALEGSLSDSPEKALALPLLRQELADAKDKSKTDVDDLKNDLSRLYTTIEWGLGLVLTAVVGSAGFIIWPKRKTSTAVEPV